MIDFKELKPDEFETLVGLLLRREGHRIVRGPGTPGTRGRDYETIAPDGRSFIVEIKHFRGSIGRSHLAEFVGDLERYRLQKSAVQGLLVTSSALSTVVKQLITAYPGIEVWDGDVVAARAEQHSDIQSLFESAIESKQLFKSKTEDLISSSIVTRGPELTARLKAIPCGQNSWREYEHVSTEILTYVFTPDLSVPDIQSRSDDSLDIIDAIFRSDQAHHLGRLFARSSELDL